MSSLPDHDVTVRIFTWDDFHTVPKRLKIRTFGMLFEYTRIEMMMPFDHYNPLNFHQKPLYLYLARKKDNKSKTKSLKE